MSYSVEERKLGTDVWVELGSVDNADLSMAANLNTTAIEALHFDLGSILLVWAGADAIDATVKVQASLDKIYWCDLENTETILNAAGGDKIFHITDIGFRFLRLAFESNSATTGTMNARYLLKSRL